MELIQFLYVVEVVVIMLMLSAYLALTIFTGIRTSHVFRPGIETGPTAWQSRRLTTLPATHSSSSSSSNNSSNISSISGNGSYGGSCCKSSVFVVFDCVLTFHWV